VLHALPTSQQQQQQQQQQQSTNQHGPLTQAYHFPHSCNVSLNVQFPPLSPMFPATPISFSEQFHAHHTIMYTTPLQGYREITLSLNIDAP